MKPNLESVFADCPTREEPGPWRYWGPALMAVSLASWGLVLTAAKLVATLV